MPSPMKRFPDSEFKKTLTSVMRNLSRIVATKLTYIPVPPAGEVTQQQGSSPSSSPPPSPLAPPEIPKAELLSVAERQAPPDEPPPHVPCKIYYPSLRALDPAQRRYYCYWREQYLAGNALRADTTYLFLFAYELPETSKSLDELEIAWTAILRAYITDAKFAQYVAGWIVDLRFQVKRYVVDDVLALEPVSDVRLDMILLAKAIPTWVDVVSVAISHPLAIGRIASYLTECKADIEAVVALARSMKPIAVPQVPFGGLATAQNSTLLKNPRKTRPSFVANPVFFSPIEALVENACEVLNISYTRGHPDTFVISGDTPQRVPIVRTTLPIPAPPEADTLAGVVISIRHVLDEDACVLLAVVLASSESLPYVEGRVDAIKELRDKFEAIAIACGRSGKIGQFRSAFFELGRGPRAMWILEPAVENATDIRMGFVVARFTRGLQRALSGSIARRSAIENLVAVLAQRTGTEPEAIISALIRICGASSSILPTIEKEVAS